MTARTTTATASTPAIISSRRTLAPSSSTSALDTTGWLMA